MAKKLLVNNKESKSNHFFSTQDENGKKKIFRLVSYFFLAGTCLIIFSLFSGDLSWNFTNLVLMIICIISYIFFSWLGGKKVI